ncbi:MAG: hypothetical protein CM15mP70_17960 [Pelagibacteraceae bacterium]|nr:MAG: hypothetical protein CM15mP70_17960 [Pelagibacteraceae bacterium]
MEEFKNLIVNNKAVAGILSQISQTNVKLSNNIEDDSNYHSYFFPQNLLKNNEKHTLLDTFGILSKSKLLLREPISGSQISFYSVDYNHSQADDEKGYSLKSENVKNFYSCIFDNLDHKYSSSFFTNLKSNSNVSIIFPNNKSAHLISDSVNQLKSYAKKIFNIKINENQILTSSLPLDISIFEDGKLKKTIAIKNKSYLGISHQLANILHIFLKESKNDIKSSENYTNYINKIYFTFFNFFPNFLNTHIFKFLLRLTGPRSFSNQILEINNFYTDQNYFFSNAIDDNQSSSLFFKGNFFPEIKIEGSSKSIFSLLKGESNLICSSNFSPKQKINTILLANSYSKNQYDAKITDSVYELLNLDKCYYLVSPSGLITMVDLNSNLNQKSSLSSSKSKYSDTQQKTLDNFNVNKFKPSLPKIKLRFPFFQKN